MRAVRADALPEHTEYRDRGCEVSPTCLRCPLPQCKYDVVLEGEKWVTRERARRAHALRQRGYPPKRIAEVIGVSKRTVYRLLDKEIAS